jgi:protein gp37
VLGARWTRAGTLLAVEATPLAAISVTSDNRGAEMQLIKYDAACRALAEARSTDEVREVRDRAEAMRTYARQAKNKDLEADAAEIRLRAERRLGELIAKQRDEEGLHQGGRPRNTGSPADPVAKATLEEVGIDKHLADRARKLARVPTDEFEQRLGDWRGDVAEQNARVTIERFFAPEIEAARQAAAAKRKATIDGKRRYSWREWNKLGVDERAAAIASASGSATFNEQGNEESAWSKWSWNPITGCRHACPFCYARDIARKAYPWEFEPTFLPDTLVAPENTRVPASASNNVWAKNVFVGSMGDMFGRWVPSDWIEAILDRVRSHPEWNFLLLTKFPARYREFTFPNNAWLGATVDHQARVRETEEAMAAVDVETKWLSIEPMLTPLRFDRLDQFDWIALGGASPSRETPATPYEPATPATPEWRPPIEWWYPLHREAEANGVRVYHKANLYERTIQFPWQPVQPR